MRTASDASVTTPYSSFIVQAKDAVSTNGAAPFFPKRQPMKATLSNGSGRQRHKYSPLGNAAKLGKIPSYKAHNPFYLVRVHE